VIAAGVTAALGATLLACWQSTPMPSDLPMTAERLEQAASGAGAVQVLPERYAAYRRRLVEARSLFQQEAGRWCFLQERARVEQAFADLEGEGRALLLAARERSATLRQEVVGAMESAQRRLARLRALEARLGLYLHQPPLAAADLALREARHYLSAGAHERARGLGDVAVASLRRAEGQAWSQLARYTDGPVVTQWLRWIQQTAEWSRTRRSPAIVVAKAERRLFLYQHGRVVADYPVDLGFNGLADKLYEGDGATPEGRFRVVAKKGATETLFYRALVLDYPTPLDRRRHERAARRGLIPRQARIGGLIEIHGEVPGTSDRTSGCVALENGHLQALFDLLERGTPVTIVGAASARNPVAQRARAWPEAEKDSL
jgi:hypothetical protein